MLIFKIINFKLKNKENLISIEVPTIIEGKKEIKKETTSKKQKK